MIQAPGSLWAWLCLVLHLNCLRIPPSSGGFHFHKRMMVMVLVMVMVMVMVMLMLMVLPQDDLAAWVSWLRYPSPQYWASHPILERELGPVIVRIISFPVASISLICFKLPTFDPSCG